jgi:hypothetical protein
MLAHKDHSKPAMIALVSSIKSRQPGSFRFADQQAQSLRPVVLRSRGVTKGANSAPAKKSRLLGTGCKSATGRKAKITPLP